MISYHTCPTDEPGQHLAGGMNVLLRGFLEATTWPTTVVTRSLRAYERVQLTPHVELHRLPVEAAQPWTREQAWERLPRFAFALHNWLSEQPRFEVISAHYWMSAWLLNRLNLRGGVIFHTLQAQKPPSLGIFDQLRKHWESDLIERYPTAYLHWHDLDNARKHYPNLRGAVVRPGIRFPETPRRPPPGPPWVLGWAARNDPIKKLDEALDWLEQQRRSGCDLQLLVAGTDGETRPHVQFLGPLEHQRMHEFYARIHQLLNWSAYETFGLSVLEALAAGAMVGLREQSDWARRLRKLHIPHQPGQLEPSAGERGRELARCYRWKRALPSWERWLRTVARIVSGEFPA